MTLSDKQSDNLLEDVGKLIDTVIDLEQKIINLNHKIKAVSISVVNLIEHTNMPEPQIMPCDPDDGSWVGR
jgi:hypothetical protein